MLSRQEEKINHIRDGIWSFGKSIYAANHKVLLGIETRNIEEFKNARVLLKNIEGVASQIDNEIVKSLALFGPEATDLRELIAYLKITSEFIRISDSIKSFSKNMVTYLESNNNFDSYKDSAIQLCKSAIKAVDIAISSLDFNCDTEDMYRKAVVEESKSDDLYGILEKSILSELAKSLDFSTNYIQTLRTLRKFAKMSDRSVAVVRLMLYARSGGKLKLYR